MVAQDIRHLEDSYNLLVLIGKLNMDVLENSFYLDLTIDDPFSLDTFPNTEVLVQEEIKNFLDLFDYDLGYSYYINKELKRVSLILDDSNFGRVEYYQMRAFMNYIMEKFGNLDFTYNDEVGFIEVAWRID